MMKMVGKCVVNFTLLLGLIWTLILYHFLFLLPDSFHYFSKECFYIRFIFLYFILHYLEVLQKISAGDFVASNLLFYKSVWSEEERHQIGQLFLKLSIDV